MNNFQWRYIKPIVNKDIIQDFESHVVYVFSDSFKKCVLDNNGARPSLSVFNTDKTKERVMKSLLSFNKEDKDNIWSLNDWAQLDLSINKLIAFAIDNYGNLICFNANNDQIVFWNHENSEIEFIAKDFDEFLNCLYE